MLPDVVVPDVVVPDVVVLDVVVSDTVVLDAVVPGSIFFHKKENVIVNGSENTFILRVVVSSGRAQ